MAYPPSSVSKVWELGSFFSIAGTGENRSRKELITGSMSSEIMRGYTRFMVEVQGAKKVQNSSH